MAFFYLQNPAYLLYNPLKGVDMITFDEFKKLELKVAKIVEVKDHPNADKLYVLIIEVDNSKKQLVAGIKNHYKPEELIDKQIIVINNIEPATIRGEKSEGMLLVAQDDERMAILIPEKPVKSGSIIR